MVFLASDGRPETQRLERALSLFSVTCLDDSGKVLRSGEVKREMTPVA